MKRGALFSFGHLANFGAWPKGYSRFGRIALTGPRLAGRDCQRDQHTIEASERRCDFVAQGSGCSDPGSGPCGAGWWNGTCAVRQLPLAGFTRGSVSLTATPDDNNFVLSGAFAPGDHAVRGITVKNSGSLALRYAVTSISADDGLASWLDLTVWKEDAEGDTGDDCGQQPPAITLYGPGDPSSLAGTRLIGDPAQGFQDGDRTLPAGASEKLCFMLAMPLSVGNTHQSSKASPEFHFDAEQVDGNP